MIYEHWATALKLESIKMASKSCQVLGSIVGLFLSINPHYGLTLSDNLFKYIVSILSYQFSNKAWRDWICYSMSLWV